MNTEEARRLAYATLAQDRRGNVRPLRPVRSEYDGELRRGPVLNVWEWELIRVALGKLNRPEAHALRDRLEQCLRHPAALIPTDGDPTTKGTPRSAS